MARKKCYNINSGNELERGEYLHFGVFLGHIRGEEVTINFLRAPKRRGFLGLLW